MIWKNFVVLKLKNKKIELCGVWFFLCGLGKNILNKIMIGKFKNRLKSFYFYGNIKILFLLYFRYFLCY